MTLLEKNVIFLIEASSRSCFGHFVLTGMITPSYLITHKLPIPPACSIASSLNIEVDTDGLIEGSGDVLNTKLTVEKDLQPSDPQVLIQCKI